MLLYFRFFVDQPKFLTTHFIYKEDRLYLCYFYSQDSVWLLMG